MNQVTKRGFMKQMAGIGLFSILPGAGRVWKAERKVVGLGCTVWPMQCVRQEWILPIIYRRAPALWPDLYRDTGRYVPRALEVSPHESHPK